jgi:tetratricopeptide (TPR) repeat protein
MKSKFWKFAGSALILVSLALAACASSPERVKSEGELLYEKGELDNAIAACTNAIQINPNDREAYYYRGRSYLDKGEYDKAIDDFTESIRQSPGFHINAYNYRGRAFYRKGDYNNAIADFTIVLTMTSPNVLRPGFNPLVERGIAYFDNEEYDLALEDFNEAIQARGRFDPVPFYWRGEIERMRGDYDSAIADYTEAIQLAPEWSGPYNNRGLTYYDKGDIDQAIADYSETIRVNQNNDTAYYNRGMAYYNKGDNDQAIADFEAALGINPNFTTAKTNLEFLRQQRGQ